MNLSVHVRQTLISSIFLCSFTTHAAFVRSPDFRQMALIGRFINSPVAGTDVEIAVFPLYQYDTIEKKAGCEAEVAYFLQHRQEPASIATPFSDLADLTPQQKIALTFRNLSFAPYHLTDESVERIILEDAVISFCNHQLAICWRKETENERYVQVFNLHPSVEVRTEPFVSRTVEYPEQLKDHVLQPHVYERCRLSFSPDGRSLAATLNHNSGLLSFYNSKEERLFMTRVVLMSLDGSDTQAIYDRSDSIGRFTNPREQLVAFTSDSKLCAQIDTCLLPKDGLTAVLLRRKCLRYFPAYLQKGNRWEAVSPTLAAIRRAYTKIVDSRLVAYDHSLYAQTDVASSRMLLAVARKMRDVIGCAKAQFQEHNMPRALLYQQIHARGRMMQTGSSMQIAWHAEAGIIQSIMREEMRLRQRLFMQPKREESRRYHANMDIRCLMPKPYQSSVKR